MNTSFVFGSAEDNLHALALDEMGIQDAQMWADVEEHLKEQTRATIHAEYIEKMDEIAQKQIEWEQLQEDSCATYVCNGSLPHEVAGRMAARVHMMSEDPNWSCFELGGCVNGKWVYREVCYSLGEAITALEAEVVAIRKKMGQQWGPCERIVDPYGTQIYRYEFKDIDGYLDITEAMDDRWMDL